MSGEKKLSERFSEGFFSMREKVKERSKVMGEKMSEGMTQMSAKMKDLMKNPTIADRLVDEATSENVTDPDWGRSLAICDLVNEKKATGAEVVGAIRRRLEVNDHRVQGHALTLLEMVVKNCEGVFADVAQGRVLEAMVPIGEDSTNPQSSKALIMIESWGEAKEELKYLPVFEETYNSMRSRGVVFPGRDNESLAPIFTPPQSVPITAPPAAAPRGAVTHGGEGEPPAVAAPPLSEEEQKAKTKEVFDVARNSMELLNTVLNSAPEKEALKDEVTTALVAHCRRSQQQIMLLIQTAGDNESVMFEALNVNDELQKMLTKFDELAGVSGKDADMEAALAASRQQAAGPLPASTAAGTATEASAATGGATSGPGPHMYADILGEDEEDLPLGSEGEALVRKGGPKGGVKSGTEGGAEDPMADLDELVFGKKGQEGSSLDVKKKDSSGP